MSKNGYQYVNASLGSLTRGMPQGVVKGGSVDDRTHTKTIRFERQTKIVSFGANDPNTPVSKYSDLPEVSLTPEEKAIDKEIGNSLKNNGQFVFIKDFTFNGEVLKVFLERGSYSLLRAVNSGKISALDKQGQARWYKTGSVFAFKTSDGDLHLLERSRGGLMAPPAGFAQPFSVTRPDGECIEGQLHVELSCGILDLFRRTALSEATEELLSQQVEGAPTPTKIELGDFTLSVRNTLSTTERPIPSMPTIEFFFSGRVGLRSAQLQEMIINNTAVDASEHTEKFIAVTAQELNSPNKALVLIHRLMVRETPGALLFIPAILAAMPARDAHSVRRTLVHQCKKGLIKKYSALGSKSAALVAKLCDEPASGGAGKPGHHN